VGERIAMSPSPKGTDDPAEKYRVLLIDDDGALLETLEAAMEDRYIVSTTTSATIGLKRLAERPHHVVVSDWQMPGMDGVALFREVRKLAIPVACLLMTGRLDQFSLEVAASDRKLLGLIGKPFPPQKLFERIDQLALLAIMKRSVQQLKKPT
jgi:two-component system response regulator GlrR